MTHDGLQQSTGQSVPDWRTIGSSPCWAPWCAPRGPCQDKGPSQLRKLLEHFPFRGSAIGSSFRDGEESHWAVCTVGNIATGGAAIAA
jgi:hypothetical protein